MNVSSADWSRTARRLTAVASMLSAFTTLVLIFGPNLYPAPSGIEDRVALQSNPWFRLRAWTYYVHPFLVFLAALGVWRIARRTDAGFALFGILALGVWAYTEALQQALTLVAVGWNWLPEWPAADAAGRAAIEERTALFMGLWDGLYFLLLTGFLIGNLCLGLALRRAAGFDRLIGWLLLAVAALTVATFIAGYGGPGWVGTLTGFAYPAMQPAIRLLTGLWLWRRA